MTPDDLARRLVACERWKWLEPMRWIAHRDGQLPRAGRVRADAFRCEAFWTEGTAPDLHDDATAGILLSMLARDIGPGWRNMMLMSHEDNHWSICDYTEGGPEYRADHLGVTVAQALLEVWNG